MAFCCFLGLSERHIQRAGFKEEISIYKLISDKFDTGSMEIVDLDQFNNTFIVSQNVIIVYDVSTGETEKINYKFSNISSINIYGNELYVLDSESNIIYVFSTYVYNIVNKYQLDSDIHIMDFAVGTNSLLLYGYNGTDNYYFIVIDKINDSIETIETNIRVDELFNYNENEVLMHVNSDSSSDSYFTPYNIDDDTFSLQYKSNVTSVISSAWDNIGKNIIFSNYDNITKTYYLKSLNTDSGLISTLKF